MTQLTIDDLLLLDALGCLGEEESSSLRKLLAAAGANADVELQPYRDAAALIAQSLDPVAPPPSVKQRILGTVRSLDTLDSSVPENCATVRADDGKWTSPIVGVRVKKLFTDPQRNSVTVLMRLDPGAILPPHDHRGAEDTFVVAGSCRIGSVSLSQGDFHHVDAGAHHGNVVTDTGCTLLLVLDAGDYRAA